MRPEPQRALPVDRLAEVHADEGVSESLAGRADIVELEGLSFREIAGPPENSAASASSAEACPSFTPTEIDALAFANSYLATYSSATYGRWQRRSLRDFERFLRACACAPQTC